MRRRNLKKVEVPVLEKKYNVSYLDPVLPTPTIQQAVRHLVSAAVVYGSVLLIFTFSPYFQEQLGVEFYGISAIKIYWYILATYLIIDTPICIYLRPKSLWISNPVRITGYLSRVIHKMLRPAKQEEEVSWTPTYEEKHAIFFFIVKMIYGPLSLNCAIDGFNRSVPIIEQLRYIGLVQWNISTAEYFNIIYMLFITIAFTIEALPYIISYHADSKLLGNKLRYVETNPFHLFVCLACYPPFNFATVSFLGSSFNDPFSIVWRGDLNHPVTWILRILAMIAVAVLISASLTLFTRASNLTNRGIVKWGPYRIVRHPGYISKNIYWLLTYIPALIPDTAAPQFTWSGYAGYCAVTFFGIVGWGTLYFLRGITEERFLMRDPEYVEYCKKVKYHFIPGIY
ncbi:MAG: hypothetical protein JW787_11145 [Sedimentisphaerales bacterium]|nr:hypothetical protein [Sedimentisphaerales bacterium]